MASIPLPSSINFFNEPCAMPRSFSIEEVPLRNSTTSLPNAVAATSGSRAIESTAAPIARISGTERAAASPRASMRLEKSTIFGEQAVEVEASRKMEEPTRNIASSTPYLPIRPDTSVILARAVNASSPKSSFNATFTWSAARTKPAKF